MTVSSLNPILRARRSGLSHGGIASMAVVSLAFSLASCGTSDAETDEGVSSSVTTITITSTARESTTETSTTEDSDALSLDLYRRVIESPESFPVKGDADFVARGNYSYALVEATGDDHPELLLMTDGMEFSPVSVFTTEGDRLVQAEGVLIDGAAGAGGQRLRVKGSNSGAGLYQVDHHSMSVEGQSTLYGIEEGSISPFQEPETFLLANPHPDHHEIEWFDTEDSSGLESLPGYDSSTLSISEPVESTKAPVVDDADAQKLTGVVYKKTAEELMEGVPTPNGESLDLIFYTLVLDSPTTVTGRRAAPDPGTAFVDEIALSDHTGFDWSPYVGERITVSTTTEHFWFPSDTSLPLGMVRMGEFTFVD